MRTIPRVVYRAGFSARTDLAAGPGGGGSGRLRRWCRRRIMASGRGASIHNLGVIRQLYQPGDSVAVYLTGGVFNAGETLLRPYRSAPE